jgi:CRP/FNR family cyclic AMP-dependent transcriptional regulator
LARQSGTTSKTDTLKQVPLFATLSKKDLAAIAGRAELVSVPSGAWLAKEGEPGIACYVLLSGAASVRKKGRKIANLGPGDVLGEMSLIDGLPRSATVQVTEDADVLELHRRDFISLIDQSPGLARKLLSSMSARLRDADARLLG